jgi:hypothetical protein
MNRPTPLIAPYGPNAGLVHDLVIEPARQLTGEQRLDFYVSSNAQSQEYAAAGFPVSGDDTAVGRLDEALEVAQLAADRAGRAAARQMVWDDARESAIEGGSNYEDYPPADHEGDDAWAAAAYAATALVVWDLIPAETFRDLYDRWGQVFGWPEFVPGGQGR